jgi:hypothetical protein
VCAACFDWNLTLTMNQKRIVFTPNSLLKLLTHYTDGAVPLDCECLSVSVNPAMERMIAIDCKSDNWCDTIESDTTPGVLKPLEVRYEGKKTMSWGGQHQELEWKEGVEAPKRQ